MKRYKWFVAALVVLFSAVAFVPALAFPWKEKISWQRYAMVYSSHPSEYIVNSTVDASDANPGDGICETAAGECTLRAAIDEANHEETLQAGVFIEVPAGTYTLTQTDQDPYYGGDTHLSIHRNSSWFVAIRGQGADNTIIQSDGTAGVMLVTDSVILSDLTIQNGASDYEPGKDSPGDYHGGGITTSGGVDLRITNCVIRDNHSVHGGGILVRDFLDGYVFVTLEDSTIDGNSAGEGGGVYNDSGSVIIRRSTISHNTANEDGGGILNHYLDNAHNVGRGTVTLENSTISGNSAKQGGGLFQDDYYGYDSKPLPLYNVTVSDNSAQDSGGGIAFSYGKVSLSNTIVAGNHSDAAPDCFTNNGSLLSNGYNLIGSTTGCDFTSTTEDQVDLDAGLDTLQDNDGATQTHALLNNSPAIDGGNPAGCLDSAGNVLHYDQRGYPRRGILDPLQPVCDIGAYEVSFSWFVRLPFVARNH